MAKIAFLLSGALILLTGCTTSTTQTHLLGAQKERFESLQKEAESGHSVSAYRIFLLRAQRDPVAMKYLRLSAENYVPAMSVLGAILMESEDASERAQGEKYLRMAALLGDMDAKTFLELRGIVW